VAKFGWVAIAVNITIVLDNDGISDTEYCWYEFDVTKQPTERAQETYSFVAKSDAGVRLFQTGRECILSHVVPHS
jgi:hypothetical protein